MFEAFADNGVKPRWLENILVNSYCVMRFMGIFNTGTFLATHPRTILKITSVVNSKFVV